MRRCLTLLLSLAVLTAGCAPAPSPTAVDPANPITFTGVGGVYPGQLARNAKRFGFPIPPGGDVAPSIMCRSSQNTKYPGVFVIYDGMSLDTLRVAAMYVKDPRFATSSGMRVSTTEAELRKTYGTRLKVVRREGTGWIGTARIWAIYHDVAVIVNGDRSITFVLNSDHRVMQIKISTADGLGDDEGCV